MNCYSKSFFFNMKYIDQCFYCNCILLLFTCLVLVLFIPCSPGEDPEIYTTFYRGRSRKVVLECFKAIICTILPKLCKKFSNFSNKISVGSNPWNLMDWPLLPTSCKKKLLYLSTCHCCLSIYLVSQTPPTLCK